MRSNSITLLLLVVGIIHLLPVSGLLGGKALESLYLIKIDSPDLEILMRHRAILFGLLGGFICYSAFRQELQPIAFIISGISVTSFLALCLSVDQVNEALYKVVVADVVALASLAIAVVLYFVPRS